MGDYFEDECTSGGYIRRFVTDQLKSVCRIQPQEILKDNTYAATLERGQDQDQEDRQGCSSEVRASGVDKELQEKELIRYVEY